MADEALQIRSRPAGWLPGWTSLRTLTPASLPGEAAAGLSIAAVAIPVGLAYAGLVGAPPQHGLYASIFPMVAYALCGPSRYLVVGPDTATCLLVGSAITAMGIHGADQRAVAAAALALVAGLGFGLASLARLGFLASLLSRPILVGYMGGVALTLLISQIASFTAVDIHEPGLVGPFLELARRSGEIHGLTLALGAGLLAMLLALKRLAPRLPGPAIVVGGAILLSWLLDLHARGVAVLGPIPSGLPAPTLPRVPGRLGELGLSALGLFFVSFASGILTARSFGVKLGVNNDANLELRGFAAANIVAGLTQGFAVTGADSRTAVNLAAGGRTPASLIAAALLLALVAVALTGPLALLPQAALGAVLASAAIGLFDLAAFRRLAQIGPAELFLALVAMAGVIWVGVLQGVFLAVAVTFIHMLRMTAWPRYSQLGRMEGRTDLVSLDHHPEAQAPADGVAFRFEASLVFVNADHFRERALAAVDARPEVRWLVVDASPMAMTDATAVETLTALRVELQARGIRLAVAGAHGKFHETLRRAGLASDLGAQGLFPNAAAAVAAIEAAQDPLTGAEA